MGLLCWRCGAKRRILGLGHEAPPVEVARGRRGRRVPGPLPDGAHGEGAAVSGAREPPPRGPPTPDGGCGAQKALQQSPAAGLHRDAEVLGAFRRDRPLRRLRLRSLRTPPPTPGRTAALQGGTSPTGATRGTTTAPGTATTSPATRPRSWRRSSGKLFSPSSQTRSGSCDSGRSTQSVSAGS